MEIRHATLSDLPEIMEIYAHARKFMADHGNASQWGATSWPPEALIRQDIREKKSFVCCEGSRLLAVFFFDFGKEIEPTYAEIENGSWISDSPYGVIHRIAAAENTHGCGSFCINRMFDQCGHLRIDTHENNYVMRNLLEKLGFSYRGIIYVYEDKDPRLAFEKIT